MAPQKDDIEALWNWGKYWEASVGCYLVIRAYCDNF